MNKYAMIIAIEKYRDKSINKLPFVEEDGKEFRETLRNLDFKDSNIIYLINRDATKTYIESELKNIMKRLIENDEFIFFFSGHGFSKNDQNFITTFDTKKGDLEDTSISLQFIFKLIKKCKSQRIMMFLDSCHSSLPIDESMKDITTSMTDQELIDFFNESKYTVGFASCQTDQISYTSSALSHSIWTYHLLEALNGKRSNLISRGKYITASDLQNFLSIEVPKSVINYRTTGIQNPIMFGNLSRDFIVADLSKIMEERKKISLSPIKIDRALFSTEIIDSIKSLSGFKRHHRIPQNITSSTKEFVKNIAEEELKPLLDKVYGKIKANFKFKRADVKYEYESGEGRIITPDFEFFVGINQSADDPAEYVERLECYNINSNELVNSDEFNEVFSKSFDTIEFNLKNSVDVEEIIDLVEDMKTDDLEIDYPLDCSYCVISLNGLDVTIRLTTSSLRIVENRRLPPRNLLKSFLDVRKNLLKYDKLKMLE